MNTREETLRHTLTRHAIQRMQQRGIPLLVVQMIENFGKRMHQNKGIKIYLDKCARQRICEHLGEPLYVSVEKHLNAYLIECDGYIVTVGHAYRRIRRS